MPETHPDTIRFICKGTIFSYQHKPVTYGQQNIFHPGIRVHKIIELKYTPRLSIPASGIHHLPVPQHIIRHNHATGPHPVKNKMIIIQILPLVRINKYQIEEFIQPGNDLTRISHMKANPLLHPTPVNKITDHILQLIVYVYRMNHSPVNHPHCH